MKETKSDEALKLVFPSRVSRVISMYYMDFIVYFMFLLKNLCAFLHLNRFKTYTFMSSSLKNVKLKYPEVDK